MLEQSNDASAQTLLDHAIATAKLNTLICSVGMTSSSDDSSHRLLHIDVGTSLDHTILTV